MGTVLVVCGLVAMVYGVSRGFLVARSALGPFLHEGEATRTLIDARRPVLERTRVRLLLRRTFVALGWLAIGMYGLFLLSLGLGLR
jgi:hypothetical protein